jgi:hemin uptake protein HemP
MILIKGDNSSLIRHNTKSYDLNKGRQLIINRTIQKVMILIKGDNSSLLRHNTKSYDFNKGRQLITNKTQYKKL